MLIGINVAASEIKLSSTSILELYVKLLTPSFGLYDNKYLFRLLLKDVSTPKFLPL